MQHHRDLSFLQVRVRGQRRALTSCDCVVSLCQQLCMHKTHSDTHVGGLQAGVYSAGRQSYRAAR